MAITLTWLSTNETLTALEFRSSTIDHGDNHSIRGYLARVFRHNKSLEIVSLPYLCIHAVDMDLLVNGLAKNKTVTCINFTGCSLDQGAWNRLERALRDDSPNQISISCIELPHPPFDEPECMISFLRSLPRMSGIRKVKIESSFDVAENELLLLAVQETKTLLSVESRTARTPDDMVDYYLKLNRFGRRILDHTNWPSGLWPVILSRMARDPKNADALLFFLCEYFSNHRGGNQQQHSPSQVTQSVHQEQRHVEDQSSPPRPCKLARLD
jgi:hypothetical protein